MHIIEDDKTSYCKSTNPWKDKTPHDQPRKANMDLTQEMVNPQQYWAIPVVKPARDEEGMSNEALLLRYHRLFGHISFSRLQDIAKIGIIPKRLKKCRIPMCSA